MKKEAEEKDYEQYLRLKKKFEKEQKLKLESGEYHIEQFIIYRVVSRKINCLLQLISS